MRDFLTNHIRPKTLAVQTKGDAEYIRKSFKGGRTQCHCPIVELTDEQLRAGWRLCYPDIASLYPTVVLYDGLPAGVPTTLDPGPRRPGFPHSGIHEWLLGKCGFLTVDVECPTDLLHPVLPEKVDGKLNFTLEPKPEVEQVFAICEL